MRKIQRTTQPTDRHSYDEGQAAALDTFLSHDGAQ